MKISEKLDKVCHDFLTLKKMRRTGWQLRGIRDCESIADHCFGVVFLTHYLSKLLKSTKLNSERAVSLAIVHEIGETRVGDIPYTALKYYKDKSNMEHQAVADVLEPFGEEITAESLELFDDFENGKTKEARFVRAIDKLEMLITGSEYEKAGYSGLSDFWANESTFKCFEEFPEIAEYAAHLKKTRDWRISGHHDKNP